jgi:hypothetical protein
MNRSCAVFALHSLRKSVKDAEVKRLAFRFKLLLLRPTSTDALALATAGWPTPSTDDYL